MRSFPVRCLRRAWAAANRESVEVTKRVVELVETTLKAHSGHEYRIEWKTTMAELVVNRTIRPSSRGAKSRSYKVDTSSVGSADTLAVTVAHESKPFRRNFWFSGRDVTGRKSISIARQESRFCNPE